MSKPKGLAVASGGGHWQQLMLLSPAFENCDIMYVSTNVSFVDQERCPKFHVVSDTNRYNPVAALRCAVQCVALIWRERPDFVLSTGALPGLICVAVGQLRGANTLWIDSLANSEKPSMSGRVARWFVDHWFTQWEHLARPDHDEFEGALL